MSYAIIQSQVKDKDGNNLCLDIRGASNAPGTQLDGYSPNGNDNQLWTAELDDPTSYYFIRSKLNDPERQQLVIDINGANLKSGAKIQVSPKKGKDYDNQLWQILEVVPGGWVIQSLLADKDTGQPLIIEIQGDHNLAFSASLPLTYSTNQLWSTTLNAAP